MVFLLWGSSQFINIKSPGRLFIMFLLFLAAWTFSIPTFFNNAVYAQLPLFSLLGLGSVLTAIGFFKVRRRHPEYLGAGLLGMGFLIWGGYLFVFPVLESLKELSSAAFFILAVLQIFIAVSMIVLVLEEARQAKEAAIEEAAAIKTERNRFRNSMEMTQAQYKSLFEQAREGIIITDESCSILKFNPIAGELFGLETSGSEPQVLNDFFSIHPEDPIPGHSGKSLIKWLSKRRQFSIKRKDGVIIPAEGNGAEINFAGRIAYQFFFRELSEVAGLEEKLRQEEKFAALGKMLSGLGHELNNPLAIVSTHLQTIKSTEVISSSLNKSIDKASSELERVINLVRNFTSLAKGRPKIISAANPVEVAGEVANPKLYGIESNNIKIKFESTDIAPQILCDTSHIKRAIQNIVTNSVQAISSSNDKGEIRISIDHDKSAVRINIVDNGPGIPEDISQKVFDPFYTTKDQSTGLGLTTAFSIAKDHGGSLTYKTVPSGGACFVLELPTIENAPDEFLEGTKFESILESRHKAQKQNLSILVLDDETELAALFGQTIELLGHKPSVCHTPNQALELIDSTDFDVILSDFKMPNMNGDVFFNEVKRIKPVMAERIIFLTGDVFGDEAQEFFEKTKRPYIMKPFQLGDLEAAISELSQ